MSNVDRRLADGILGRLNTLLTEGWITVNGAHIEINDEGDVEKGPAALKDKDFSRAKSKSLEDLRAEQAANRRADAQKTARKIRVADKLNAMDLQTPEGRKQYGDFHMADMRKWERRAYNSGKSDDFREAASRAEEAAKQYEVGSKAHTKALAIAQEHHANAERVDREVVDRAHKISKDLEDGSLPRNSLNLDRASHAHNLAAFASKDPKVRDEHYAKSKELDLLSKRSAANEYSDRANKTNDPEHHEIAARFARVAASAHEEANQHEDVDQLRDQAKEHEASAKYYKNTHQAPNGHRYENSEDEDEKHLNSSQKAYHQDIRTSFNELTSHDKEAEQAAKVYLGLKKSVGQDPKSQQLADRVLDKASVVVEPDGITSRSKMKSAASAAGGAAHYHEKRGERDVADKYRLLQRTFQTMIRHDEGGEDDED